MQDGEIQREILKETQNLKKALEIATNVEIGKQNQLKVLGTHAYTPSIRVANHPLRVFRNRGTIHGQTQTISSLPSVQIVVILGHPATIRTAQHEEKFIKMLASLTILQKFVANQRTR